MTDYLDSTDGRITYQRIQERAKQDAMEHMPELPKGRSEGHWMEFIEEVEAVDAYDVAHQCSEWDWVIYYARAMELCQAVPSDVLHEAEDQYKDFGRILNPHGLYELAGQIADLIVIREIADAVEEAKEELLELANDELDKLEA